MLNESFIPSPVSLGPAHFCFHLGHTPSFKIICDGKRLLQLLPGKRMWFAVG